MKSKVVRRTDSKAAREYWTSLEKLLKEVNKMPEWMKRIHEG